MHEVTRESIIEAAKTAASQGDRPFSQADFIRLTGMSQYHIYRMFPDGGWSEILREAGLEPHPNNIQPISDDDLLAEFHRAVCELGTVPTWAKFDSLASVSSTTIKKRFRGRQGTLAAYRAWLTVNAADSPMLAVLDEHARSEPTKRSGPPTRGPEPSKPSASAKIEGIEYGAPISFRGLRHAPINEQGVVYLFGMVSNELGLIVEAVQTGFPDCEAKRCVNNRENRWQRVRIEFEFRSRNFREHGHDAAGCDLIVCWEHDWPECPLEVIELRTMIKRLEG